MSGLDWESLRKRLDEPIPKDKISQRQAGGSKMLDYLEGWYVKNRLNELFGQGNWNYRVNELRLVHSGTIERESYGKTVQVHTVHYLANVALSVSFDYENDTTQTVVFNDYGYGDGEDKVNIGKAHELAAKEAVTDGVKRCAMNLGMSMGMALYDKSRAHVEGTTARPKGAMSEDAEKQLAWLRKVASKLPQPEMAKLYTWLDTPKTSDEIAKAYARTIQFATEAGIKTE